MALTNEQIEKFRTHARKKFKSHYCVVCNENDWDYGDFLKMSPMSDKEEGTAKALFPLTCKNCAYVRLFDAKQIGLL